MEIQSVSGEVKSGAEAIFRLDHDCGENFSTVSIGCARFGGAPKRHPASAVAGVSVEIKRIGQVIDLTRFNGHYLMPIHGLD